MDKYTWTDLGSSFLPSELNAAYLLAQLEHAVQINDDRLASWNHYYRLLAPLAERGCLELPFVPEGCAHNGHIFYIKAANIEERAALIRFLKAHEIGSVFHYVPLHSAPAGLRFSRFAGEDRYTTKESELLLRLPMYYGLPAESIERVAAAVAAFYR